MENINEILAENILKYRKQKELSQEELAGKLGVTFQAVSKWENAKSAPDISFLPLMADLFDCHIDELFSREVESENHFKVCFEFPWPDDSTIRGVVCEGHKILRHTSILDQFTFEVVGDVKNVQSECNIKVEGSVMGGCNAGDGVTISGSLSGGCNAGDDISVGGHLSGGCNAGDSISVGGNLSGGCNAGDDISCGGSLTGDISCGGCVSVGGDVKAETIKGDIVCNAVQCDRIEGNIHIHENH